MKLNIEQYRWILLNCNLVAIQHKGKQHALITPKYPKHNDKLTEVIGPFNLPTTEEWYKLSQELRPLMHNNAQTRYSLAVRKIIETPTTELSYMPDELKIELLDSLLFDVFGDDNETVRKNEVTVEAYKDKIEAIILNIKMPKKFIQTQKQKIANFCQELRQIPEAKRRFIEWGTINCEEKKEALNSCINALNKCFGNQIKLHFFSKPDWEEIKKNRPEFKNTEMPVEYRDRNDIYANTESLDESKDIYILTLMLQEALFLNIKHTEWNSKVIDKLLETKFTKIFFDIKEELRIISPIEAHIYGMSDEVGRFLKREMGVMYINEQYTQNVKDIVRSNRNKTRSIFHHQMYRNNKLYSFSDSN